MDSTEEDIFKYCYNGGKGGEAHKYKEQGSENPSSGHLVEDIGQGYEYQTGAFSGIYFKSKAGREND